MPIERVRRVDRRGDQRLLEREPHAEAGERQRERHRRREAAAGVHVGGERDGDAVLDQHARRREAAQLQIERGNREQRGDDAGGGEPIRGGFVDENQVIRRSRADLRGDARAAGRAELVGVDAQLHPGAPRRLQDRAALLRREDAGLAEHVAPLGEPLARDGGDHLVDDEVDVVAAAIAVLDRHLVRGRPRHRGPLRIEPGRQPPRGDLLGGLGSG